ncbi:uncharacterized protein LOC134852852 [Symsagittifera roscoffensis]|uniref:uncharacterized protein LOC134852852 n=1 Tax=Symsagittifera roscoffensis TaxID=84072 RepID=UPI00307BA6FB
MKNVVIKNINKNILFRLNSSYLSINADDHMSNRLIFHECSIDRLYEARLTDGGGTPDLVLFSETTSQDTTKVFTYPILSEFDHKFHPNLMLYIARVDAGQGAHILPRDYLYGVSKFDKFVLGSLPQRVDFGALGITELKFNWFWYECIINDETKLCGNFQVDKQTNEVWQQMKCHQIKNSRICQLCFLQFYGLHSKKDRVIQRCENKDEPKNLQVVKCTYDCPRMYDGVSDQQFADDFAGYVICDTKHQVAQSCYKNGTAKFQLRESKVGSKQSEEGPTNLLDPIKSPGDEAIEDPPGGNIQSNGSANNLEKDGNVLDFDDRGKNLCHLRSLSHQIMLTSVLIFF